MSETKPVRRIGSITIGETVYDLAMNGEALLAVESADIYGRPSARSVPIEDAADALGVREDSRSSKMSFLAQALLNQLATAMIDRDAALARVHKTGEEAK